MADNRIIPTQGATDLPTYTILAGGEDVGSTVGVISLMVAKTVNRIPYARLILSDGDVSKEDFEVSSGDTFIPGTEIEIKAGYHRTEDTIFKGLIVKQSIKSKSGKSSVLVIDLKDVSMKMTLGRNSRYFYESKDSDIIEEIIGEYGFDNDVEPTDVEHQEMVQYFSTDWDFMISRAEVNGKLVFVDDGKITVKKPDLSEDALIELAYGHNIIEFDAELDARDNFAASSGRSWDFSKQEVVEEDGEDPSIEGAGNLSTSDLSAVGGLDNFPMQHTGKVGDTELKAWSDSKLLRSRLAKVQGRVKIIGYSDIKPGHIIELAGLGDRFNGKVFVSSITHHISAESTWYTEIEFGLDQEWFVRKFKDIDDLPAAGLLPSIHGLHAGIVTNIHEDPDGEERIRVRIPVINAEEDGVWARVAALDAGNNRGVVFRPEVNDEVIVGFINDDPRYPVILGMLHSSAMPSPIPPDEENNEKGIVTRGEIKILFDDDKKVLTIQTPNENKLILSDDEGSVTIEDENGNKFIMSSDGITVDSAGDINLKASGDVNIEGTNITLSASSQFLAEGSSGAELSTSGQAVIKGSLVGIN